jgi:hypothetical protein
MYDWSLLTDLWQKEHHYSLTMTTSVSDQVKDKLKYNTNQIIVQGFLADQIGFRFGSKYMEFGLGLGNQFGGWAQAAESIASAIPGAKEKIDQIKSALGVTGGVSLLTVYNTLKFWTGYEPFTMSLNLISIILDKKSYQIYQNNFRYLTDAVLPLPSKSNNQGILISSPMGYVIPSIDQTRTAGVHPQGTWTIAIGKWFVASGFLVSNVSFNFSRQVVQLSPAEDGISAPLLIEATVELEPWRILFADEVRSFFLFDKAKWGWPE